MQRKTILILKISLIILPLLSPIFISAQGNPAPSDYSFETIPLSSDYNNSVYFKAEEMIFKFSSSRVYINANFTFQNENLSIVSLNILLPFIDSKSNEAKLPLLESLKLDGLELDYTWKTIKIPSVTNNFNFHAIEFKLLFEGQEEKKVTVLYNRDYQNGYGHNGAWDSLSEECNFNYYVGTALTWNHNISTADFEFWFPKSICDEINSEFYFDNFEETSNYFIGSIHYADWKPEEKEISIWWTNTLQITRGQEYLLSVMIILGILFSMSIFLLLMKRRKKWVEDFKTKF